MNDNTVRHLAQADPTARLAMTAGELVFEIRDVLDTLTRGLRALDKATVALQERGMTLDVDLGPIGNAAAAARRDLEKDRGQTFTLPA